MVGRPASLKYLAIASSKIMQHGSRGARLETSACVCTSMATISDTLILGTYLLIEGPLDGGAALKVCHPGIARKRNIRDPGAARLASNMLPWVPALALRARPG